MKTRLYLHREWSPHCTYPYSNIETEQLLTVWYNARYREAHCLFGLRKHGVLYIFISLSSVTYLSCTAGHARPLLHLSARFAKLSPGVAVTFLATDGFFERVKTELARAFADGDEELSNRVRCVQLIFAPCHETTDPVVAYA